MSLFGFLKSHKVEGPCASCKYSRDNSNLGLFGVGKELCAAVGSSGGRMPAASVVMQANPTSNGGCAMHSPLVREVSRSKAGDVPLQDIESRLVKISGPEKTVTAPTVNRKMPSLTP